MRGEHFLLLAEREQLLAPVVLEQLRRILAQQRRPATGEAVARLLVDRQYLSVEQARRLIEAGSGTGSPLVPPAATKPSSPASDVARTQPPHQTDELLLAPDESRSAGSSHAVVVANPAAAQRTPPPPPVSSPLIPTDADLAELTDSLRAWMNVPGTLDWNAPPSPLFAPPRWQITPSMALVGVGGLLVLLVLVVLVRLTR